MRSLRFVLTEPARFFARAGFRLTLSRLSFAFGEGFLGWALAGLAFALARLGEERFERFAGLVVLGVLARFAAGRLGVMGVAGGLGAGSVSSSATRVSSSTSVSTGSAGCASASDHPCSSRTAIIAARISFQVLGSAMTALGNIHPSQQIWRKALLSAPSSPRSQKPA